MSDNQQETLISIIGLRELGYLYLDPREHFPHFKDQSLKTKIEMQLRYSWNFDDMRFYVLTKFIVLISKESIKEKVIEYECSTDFKVEDLKNLVTQDDNKDFIIDKDFEESTVRLAIAHSRGMFFQKTISTIFRGIIYPLVDINKVLLSNNPLGLKVDPQPGNNKD